MVVFTCQHCGDSLQKPKVEKHYYQTKCRSKNPFLTCVDCLKDYVGKDYIEHTMCVTEEQRYAAKGTIVKKGKGQSKQEQYTEMIQGILNSKDLGLNEPQRRLLEICSKFTNVPRKLPKFQNFLKNVARSLKYTESDSKKVFQVLDDSFKNKPGETNGNDSLISNGNGSSQGAPAKEEKEMNNEDSNELENTPISNEKGRKKKQKKNKKANKNEDEEFNAVENIEVDITLKKISKKRKHDAALSESNVKRTKTNEEAVSPEKEEGRLPFDWADTIVQVLGSQDDRTLSVKRLAKRVLREYANVRPDDYKTHEQLMAKFNKKVKKTPGVVVLNDKARLKSAED